MAQHKAAKESPRFFLHDLFKMGQDADALPIKHESKQEIGG
jgi:hypothetical protein